MSIGFGLTAVIVLVLANGFFVAAEFALVAVRRSRLEQLAAEGQRSAIVAHEVAGQLDAYIAACQLGITMASLGLGWAGEPALARVLEPPLTALVGSFAPAAAHTVAVGVAFSVITALHIVIGELAPKGLALQAPERTTLLLARPLRLFYRVFRLPITLLNAVGNAVLRIIGLREATGHEMVHGPDELSLLVDQSRDAGVVEESEARIARRAFRFADTTAGQLLTPRVEIATVPQDASRAQVLKIAQEAHHTRLPVLGEREDDVLGVIDVRDVLTLPDEGFDVRRHLRQVPLVPDSKPADELLEVLRAGRASLAVVIDEYGAVAGVVTLHDLLEGLVGPLDEERDVARAVGPVEPDGSQVLSGELLLSEVEEVTGLPVRPEWRDAADTLGGLVMLLLGHVPKPGETVDVDGRRLRVERVHRNRVLAVRVAPEAPVPEFSAIGRG
jgi:putative hemolysin